LNHLFKVYAHRSVRHREPQDDHRPH
jgi:hypothetical protein